MSDTLSQSTATVYDLALNPKTGELAIPPQMISGEQRVAQKIWIALTIFLGEWFLDLSIGVPYFTVILVKNASGTQISSILRNVLMSLPEVLSVTNLRLYVNNQNRQLGVSFTATTNLGLVAMAGPISSTAATYAVWGQPAWGQSVWGPSSTLPTSPSSSVPGVFDSSDWDAVTWAP